jgi:hypothetical protein
MNSQLASHGVPRFCFSSSAIAALSSTRRRRARGGERRENPPSCTSDVATPRTSSAGSAAAAAPEGLDGMRQQGNTYILHSNGGPITRINFDPTGGAKCWHGDRSGEPSTGRKHGPASVVSTEKWRASTMLSASSTENGTVKMECSKVSKETPRLGAVHHEADPRPLAPASRFVLPWDGAARKFCAENRAGIKSRTAKPAGGASSEDPPTGSRTVKRYSAFLETSGW